MGGGADDVWCVVCFSEYFVVVGCGYIRGNQYALTMYSPFLRCLIFSTYTFKAFFWVLLFLVLAAHAYYFTERDSVEQVKVRRV